MSDIAIRVENLSKKYRIGKAQQRHDTLRDSLAASWHNLRHWGSKENSQTEDFWALKDVSFEVKRGEVIGVIGRNGAGKSTLLKILSQITEPTTGRVELHGRVASLLEVGTGFHPELSGRENIYLSGALLGMKRKEIKEQFDEIVDFSGITEFIDTPIKRYSSGLNVRLGFAVAAHLKPEILLIDEILSVGDIEFQKKSLGKMEQVAATGRTVLFVSHNMYTVRSLCHRTILIESGQIQIDGNTNEVIDQYTQKPFETNNNGEIFLRDWRGLRQSPGTAKIKAVRILNQKNEICSKFAINDPITFEADLENLSSNGFVLSFSAQNKQGILVYHVRSQDSPLNTKGVFPTCTLRMTISQLKLVDDIYSLHVWLGDNINRMEEYVENVLNFQVVNQQHSVNRLLSVIHETGQWEIVKPQS